jgi:hypothetical protein
VAQTGLLHRRRFLSSGFVLLRSVVYYGSMRAIIESR